jgi:Na+/H+ antiporter NhaD/arsenite permease-like protein
LGGSAATVLPALLIFLLTYLLISLRRIAHIPLERPAVALLGASLMVLARVVPPTQAIAAIDLNTILLLIGMMLVVVTLESTGFFAHIALWIVERSQSERRLLVQLALATAILSALVLNDTVVLFFTPIIVHATRLLGVRPTKYLVTEALSANIGSVATEIGNPQNAYIANASGIPFLRYLTVMGPIMLVTLAVAIALLLVLYRTDLRTPLQAQHVHQLDDTAQIQQPRLLWLSLATVGLLFVGFLASQRLALPLSLIALAGGSLLVFIAPLVGKTSPRILFRRVDWSIILLFIGLFVVLRGLQTSGALDKVLAAAESLYPGALTTVWGLGIVTAVLSNLVSNVPAVLLLAEPVARAGSESLWFTLAAASTLSGNATILGAAANIIVAEQGEERGVAIGFYEFLRIGLPVTIVTLAIALAMIQKLT